MAIDFRPALENALNEFRQAGADAKFTPSECLRLAAKAMEVLESVVGSIASDSEEEFEQLVRDAEWAVATYVVPYNIPFINDFAERMLVDPNLITMVRPMLEALRDKVHQAPI